MTQAELARRMARPLKTVNEIVNGKAQITPDTAIQLERALGISASFWNGMETHYRETLARRRAADELGDFSTWARHFPVADMARHRLLPDRRSWKEKTLDLLEFFRVSSPTGWEQHWGEVAATYRRSKTFESDPYAMAAWLRWGESEADRIDLEPFDAIALKDAVPSIKALTSHMAFPIVYGRLQELLRRAGVAFIAIDEIEGARVSGATRWLSRGAVLIQVSFRHGTDDQFWHTTFHEIGHVLTGPRRGLFIDGMSAEDGQDSRTSEEERAADTFAREALIEPADYAAFVERADLDRAAVIAFAREQQVAVGIVVGRLQHDGLLPPNRLNDLKRPYKLASG